MKSIRTSFFILGWILLIFAGRPGVSQAYTSVGFSLNFHDALGPYGTWVHVSGCSDCWRPSATGFVPYTQGRWVSTTYGMTWEGDEPWSWAPYHYGHWVYSAGYGWLWVPGYEWAPARVSWAYGADYIGWCPAYNGGYDPNLWVVVNRNDFGRRDYISARIHRDTLRTLFARRVLHRTAGPLHRTEVERIVHRSIPVTRLKERTIVVNNHRTRLIVPEDRERTVVEHISRISHKNERPVVHGSSVSVRSQNSDHHTVVHEQQRKEQHPVVHQQQRKVEHPVVHEQQRKVEHSVVHQQERRVERPAVHEQKRTMEHPVVHEQPKHENDRHASSVSTDRHKTEQKQTVTKKKVTTKQQHQKRKPPNSK